MQGRDRRSGFKYSSASIPSMESGGQAKFYMQCFQPGLTLTITDSPRRWITCYGDKRQAFTICACHVQSNTRLLPSADLFLYKSTS